MPIVHWKESCILNFSHRFMRHRLWEKWVAQFGKFTNCIPSWTVWRTFQLVTTIIYIELHVKCVQQLQLFKYVATPEWLHMRGPSLCWQPNLGLLWETWLTSLQTSTSSGANCLYSQSTWLFKSCCFTVDYSGSGLCVWFISVSMFNCWFFFIVVSHAREKQSPIKEDRSNALIIYILKLSFHPQ